VVSWLDRERYQHSEPLDLDRAEAEFARRLAAPGCLGVRLRTETDWLVARTIAERTVTGHRDHALTRWRRP
jgi:hypothetical protein